MVTVGIVLADSRIINVTITLTNSTEEKQKLDMIELNLVTSGMVNGIAKHISDFDNNSYGRLKQVLTPGETRKVTYPYEMLSLWFTKKDWKQIEERKFWLSFSQYPVKTILRLE